MFYFYRLLKERQVEDHLFGDKERFVTAAYRKKLEEDRKWQEEEKLRDEIEAAQDVRKKGHMGDFYRCEFYHCPASMYLVTRQIHRLQSHEIVSNYDFNVLHQPYWISRLFFKIQAYSVSAASLQLHSNNIQISREKWQGFLRICSKMTLTHIQYFLVFLSFRSLKAH